MKTEMPGDALDYHTPQPRKTTFSWRRIRMGLFSMACWTVAMTIFFGIYMTPISNAAGLQTLSGQHLIHRIPTAFAALGMLIGVVGIIKDERIGIALFVIVLNGATVFILVTLDALVGMADVG
jgi:hypothetical protein